MPVEEAGVAHTAARPGLVGQVAETVDAAGEDRGADLARELHARVAAGLDQMLAEVVEAALRQYPALDDADEDDERGGGEPEAGSKAERRGETDPHGVGVGSNEHAVGLVQAVAAEGPDTVIFLSLRHALDEAIALADGRILLLRV